MSNQASDIAQEAQVEFDILMRKVIRAFQDAAEAMLAAPVMTKSKPVNTVKLTLKI